MTSIPSPKTLVFTDLRYVQCGEIRWLSPNGNKLPLISPSEPRVEAHADTGLLPYGIRLAAQPAKKAGPLDIPGDMRPYLRVIFEDNVYRAWYLVRKYRPEDDFGAYSTDAPLSVGIGCAESTDGFEWHETAFCPLDVGGQCGFGGFGMFIDPSALPGERYKAVYEARPPADEYGQRWEEHRALHPKHRDPRASEDLIFCLYGAVSPDGLDWRAIKEPFAVGIYDSDLSLSYDPWLGNYVMYGRMFRQDRRWVGRAETDDFRRWPPLEPVIWPSLDAPFSDDIYLNGSTEYPGTPGYHLMLPTVYHRHTETGDVWLYSSEDGVAWSRVPGGPIISPGEPGEWDSEWIYALKDLVPLGDDRIGVLYHATDYPHKYPRWKGVPESCGTAWAWWPKDRICAVTADEEGEFFTFPVIPAGREMRINARTRRAGEVRVGLVDVPGRSISDCSPIVGDELAHVVRWKGQTDIGVPDGERVVIHVRLRAADMFAVEWV